MGIPQLDRHSGGHEVAAFQPRCSEGRDALALLGGAQNLQFLGERVHLNLAVMRAARTDQVACHDMVGERRRIGWLAFRKAIGQPGSAVRIERVAGEVVVVRGDLCERAAQ